MLSEIEIESAGQSGAIWAIRPFQIVSLLEVLRFRADSYFATATSLAALKAICNSAEPRKILTEPMIATVKGHLASIREDCESTGLKMSVLHIDGFTFSDRTTYVEYAQFVSELADRIADELSLC